MQETESSIKERARYLATVEKLTMRQIIAKLNIGYRRLKRLLSGASLPTRVNKTSPLEAYRNLVDEWYQQHPRLQAVQIYRRLKEYGYAGSISSVERFSKRWRKKRPVAYHALDFIAGEEAQIDWFFATIEGLGQVVLFLYVLSYSRYAWGKFYPKTSFEFFLDGHLCCFKHLNGLARKHRYDNVKSVVIKRSGDKIEYNSQFLEFARHYGFRIHACNPYSGNEKGRVERLGRDVRYNFLYGATFKNREELNTRFWQWLTDRNARIHRITGKNPLELLPEENLLKIPGIDYEPTRIVPSIISKTALVEFENNRYSVPSSCVLKPCNILAYPDKIEVRVNSQVVAHHKRSFEKHQKFQNPLHIERLLDRSPHFKHRRILEIIKLLDPAFNLFLSAQEDDVCRLDAAYGIFKLLKSHGRLLLASAVRELLGIRVYKIKALYSFLNLPESKEPGNIHPTDTKLMDIRYEPRKLEEYDDKQNA